MCGKTTRQTKLAGEYRRRASWLTGSLLYEGSWLSGRPDHDGEQEMGNRQWWCRGVVPGRVVSERAYGGTQQARPVCTRLEVCSLRS